MGGASDLVVLACHGNLTKIRADCVETDVEPPKSPNSNPSRLFSFLFPAPRPIRCGFQREMAGPSGDVVHVSDILKGWRDDEVPRTSSTSGGAYFNAVTGGGAARRLGSGGTSRSGRGWGNTSGGSELSARPYWRAHGRVGSTAGWSSNAGTERQGGGGGAKAAIVSALERVMSRSTYGGGGGGGGGGGRMAEGATLLPQREKNRSEELFGALMGQDDRGGGKGRWGDGGGGGAGGSKGEDGKSGEVDLGFLHRWVQHDAREMKRGVWRWCQSCYWFPFPSFSSACRFRCVRGVVPSRALSDVTQRTLLLYKMWPVVGLTRLWLRWLPSCLLLVE